MADKHMWEVDHSYYCNDGNYNAAHNESVFEFKSWQDFMAEMGDADMALAEQVQWQQMPEGWILVPDGATKEWKAALVKSGYKASTIIDDVLAAAPSIAQDGQKSEADHE